MQLRRQLVAAACLAACVPGARADNPTAEEILAAAGVRAGLCVQIHCADPALTAALARAGGLVVHALEADADAVQAARAAVGKAGLAARASVEQWTHKHLPYPDCYVNVIVAGAGSPVPEAELKRVLCPRGAALVRRNGKWTKITRPRPDGMDDWTHQKHGPDGNPVSQDTIPMADVSDSLRWVSDVLEVWSHAIRTAGGRTFICVNDTIRARDAFNGVLLWHRSFPELHDRLGWTRQLYRPVATADRIYMHGRDGLVAIGAADGRVQATFTEAGRPYDFIVADGMVVCRDGESVRGLDAATGKLRWRADAPEDPRKLQAAKGRTPPVYRFQQLYAGGGRVYFATGRKTDVTTDRLDRKGGRVVVPGWRTCLVGLEVATGKEAWRCDDAALGAAWPVLHAGGVLCAVNETGYVGAPTAGDAKPWLLRVRTWNRDRTKLEQPRLDPGQVLRCLLYAGGLI